MSRLWSVPRGTLRRECRGIAALEYALLAGLVSVVLTGVMVQYSTAQKTLYRAVDLAFSQLGGSASLGGTTTTGAGPGGTTGPPSAAATRVRFYWNDPLRRLRAHGHR